MWKKALILVCVVLAVIALTAVTLTVEWGLIILAVVALFSVNFATPYVFYKGTANVWIDGERWEIDCTGKKLRLLMRRKT